jgi:quinoprotein glucose dehydrogenase
MPGFDGGAEWGGAAWDPDSGLLYVNANEVANILQMYPSSGTGENEFFNPRGAYLMTCAMCHGADRSGFGPAGPALRDIGERMSFLELYRAIYDGRGRMPGFGDLLGRAGTLLIMYHLYTADDKHEPAPSAEDIRTADAFFHLGWQSFKGADGLPGIKPPWGTLNAIDLSTGAIRWRVPLGDYPLARSMGITGAGAENYGGPVVTAGGLLFIAATPDRQLRAFDKSSGRLLWQHELPNAGFATPTVYEAGGRQFVVIAAGGGKLGEPHGGHYVAFALDGPGQRHSTARR